MVEVQAWYLWKTIQCDNNLGPLLSVFSPGEDNCAIFHTWYQTLTTYWYYCGIWTSPTTIVSACINVYHKQFIVGTRCEANVINFDILDVKANFLVGIVWFIV
jgi:hypothetical protein